ncbi:hypothetical protein SCP_0403570 [Sparassis crispa]|uniref:Uncharacterized protein n=1 Tax=Sparassis crispa TaxID=139825 RepID=A0A401GIP1_9APHY|nr:hypothetical protein SCP_0403570 [Sparassis crispa]GBE81981.1 hypothetical protein SCP_0403570 [Sparassis crispa]
MGHTKNKTKNIKKTRGRSTWAKGSKLRFLNARTDDWQTATDLDKVSKFYLNVTKLFIKKYGWDLLFDQDAEDEIPDPPDDLIIDWIGDEPFDDPKECTYQEMCTDRQLVPLPQSKNHQGLSMLAERSDPFDMLELSPKPPRKPRLLQYYSHLHYAKHIKPHFDEEWARVESAPVLPGKKKPAQVKVRNKFTETAFLNESEEFRTTLKADLENEHEEQLKAFRNGQAEKKTAQHYHNGLVDTAMYLQPLANLIADKFGMSVSFLLAGPIPDRGGQIEVRSVHSGEMAEVIPRNWPEFDRLGFHEVENIMLHFARRCFTEAQQREWALPGTLDDQEASEANFLATSAKHTPSAVPSASSPSTSDAEHVISSRVESSSTSDDMAALTNSTSPPPENATSLATSTSALPGPRCSISIF